MAEATLQRNTEATLPSPTTRTGLTAWLFEPRRLLPSLAVLMIVLAWGIRWFQNTMSFSVGMDFYEPEFQQIWMPFLYAELAFVLVTGVGSCLYIWMTRVRDASTVTPEIELRSYFVLLGMFVVMAVWAAPIGFMSIESDAAWHQVSIRDTDFTPTHIVIFYFALPFLTAMLVATFIWAHTRLPMFMNRISLPFLIVVSGVFLIMPNYGFNEWGHTFFYAEELFAAPIHYGFVVLGWAFFCLVPLLIQIISRMAELITQVVGDGQNSAADIT